MREILDLLIDDFQERELPALTRREQTILRVPGKVSVVVGMRRTGKTWLCYQEMQELSARGVGRADCLYLNFEDERLLPFQTSDFQTILEVFYRKYPEMKQRPLRLYLDEAQRIEGWEMFVRRILDTENVEICVTGSSARLLSTEIATELRGRSLTTEVFPFGLRELLRHHRPDFDPSGPMGSKARAVLSHMIDRYLTVGGFPEVQVLSDELRRQVLRGYVDVVVLRDVVERHGVSNVVALRSLIRAMLSAPGTRFSVNKFHRDLRSQGVACSKNDLYAFLGHIEDAWLVHLIPIHSRSQRVRQTNPRKVYAADPGLLEAVSLRMTRDRGAVLENAVYLHLRRHGIHPEYYVTEDGYEVDFVYREEGEDEPTLLQACSGLDGPGVREREFRGLKAAMKELRTSRAGIVTGMEEGRDGDDPILVVPSWRWLLADPRRGFRP